MEVRLAYNRTGIPVRIPDRNLLRVLTMRPASVLADPRGQLAACLEAPIGAPPLKALVRGKRQVVIVICDVTRAAPSALMLPPILDCLHRAGVPRAAISILIATGLHRPCTPSEIEQMVGADIAGAYDVVNHRATADDELVSYGTTARGVPILINRRYAAADLKVTTGFIEPHIFAGYSGGRKLVCPGVVGAPTIRAAHGPRFLEDPHACEGELQANPVHQELLQIARRVGCDFIVNVALAESGGITGVFAGDMEAAHAAGVRHVEQQVSAAVPRPADIVLTSCAGYPLDTTWYQAIKGLTAGLPAVKAGGTMVMAAGCAEGMGGAAFEELTDRFPTIDGFMDAILRSDVVLDGQWQLECLARVLRQCRVVLYSEGLGRAWRSRLPVDTTQDLQGTIDNLIDRYGRETATVTAIPYGPYVLARAPTVA